MAIAMSCVVWAVMAASASAQAFEPNDSPTQAKGPMVGGQNYEGVIETANDADWFYFNTVGQRQLDVSLTSLSGEGCDNVTLYNADGEYIDTGEWSGNTSRILRTAPSAVQWALQVEGSTACRYRLRVDPADAITQSPPGVVVSLDASDEPDDVQRILLNGQLIGQVGGGTAQTFSLGQLPPDARLTFEGQNGSGAWSWNVVVTNHTGRQRTTVLTEQQSGGDVGDARVGVVRRVVFSPTGGVYESCGEALAPTTCIPIDDDRDGSPVGADCNDSDAAVRPGAGEVLDNGVDEDCDGVANRRVRTASTVSVKRRGSSYRGRVSSSRRECTAGRRVVLRRVGSGTRAFGRTLTRADGTYTFRRSRRLRGRIYVVATTRAPGSLLCTFSRSRRIGG